MTTKIEVKDAPKFNKKIFAPILVDIIMLAVGIFLLLWADQVIKTISIAIGAVFILYAIYNFIDYGRIQEKKSTDISKLITGIALSIAGIFLVTQSHFVIEMISFVFGIFIIIESMLHLQDAILIRKTNPNFKTPLALSMIGIACGALCILGKILIPNTIMQILGVALIIFAFVDIFGVSLTHKKVASPSKAEDDTIEAETVEK